MAETTQDTPKAAKTNIPSMPRYWYDGNKVSYEIFKAKEPQELQNVLAQAAKEVG